MYVKKRWGDVKGTSITKQIIAVTVNHDSRVHYPENHTPRRTDSGSKYDILVKITRGFVERYKPENHGVWEIYKDEYSKPKVRLYTEGRSTNAYLFAWNPQKWSWNDLEKKLEQFETTGSTTERWSCRSHKAVRVGDRAFLAQVGTSLNGIFASGTIISEPFLSQHWSGDEKEVFRVWIEFDVLLDPRAQKVLTVQKLKDNLSSQQWTPQSSGISIRSELVGELEKTWFEFLEENNVFSQESSMVSVGETNSFLEGKRTQVLQTCYERNPYARAACIRHYGYKCAVCEMDFEARYGTLGKGFIHVHHLCKIAARGKIHRVNPIEDLRPVCANCHAMLHRQDPPLTIEALKARLQ